MLISQEDIPVTTDNQQQAQDGNVNQSIDNSGGQQQQQNRINEPPPESPRFNQVYAKLKNYERKEDEWSKEKEVISKELQEVKSMLSEFQNRNIDSDINNLQQRQFELAQNGDNAGYIQITQQINELMAKKLGAVRQNQQVAAPQVQYQQNGYKQQQNVPINDNIDLALFKRNNADWFGKDLAMTGAAEYIYQSLSNDPTYSNRSMADLLIETEKRVFQSFPGYRKNVVNNSGSEGISYSSNVQQKNNELSQDEKDAAVLLFPGMKPDDAYKLYMKGKGL